MCIQRRSLNCKIYFRHNVFSRSRQELEFLSYLQTVRKLWTVFLWTNLCVPPDFPAEGPVIQVERKQYQVTARFLLHQLVWIFKAESSLDWENGTFNERQLMMLKLWLKLCSQVGETAHLSCTVQRSSPPSLLSWYINDEPVSRNRQNLAKLSSQKV